LALRHEKLGPGQIEAMLRGGAPPVISRIIDDWVIVDLRTVIGEQESQLLMRLEQTAGEARKR
jgi:hypothetical protein